MIWFCNLKKPHVFALSTANSFHFHLQWNTSVQWSLKTIFNTDFSAFWLHLCRCTSSHNNSLKHDFQNTLLLYFKRAMSPFLSHMSFVKPFILHKEIQSWPEKNHFFWQSSQNYPAWVNLRTLFLGAWRLMFHSYLLEKMWDGMQKNMIIIRSRILPVPCLQEVTSISNGGLLDSLNVHKGLESCNCIGKLGADLLHPKLPWPGRQHTPWVLTPSRCPYSLQGQSW